MPYRVILLFIFVILVTDVVVQRVHNRLACQGICKNKEDEVIATSRPRSNGKCVAFVCRNCGLKRQLISDCWSIYEDLLLKSKLRPNCTYKGTEIRYGGVIESNGHWTICVDGSTAMSTTDSLLSHVGGI